MITKKQRKAILKSVIRFLKYRILHIDDSPHGIALGVALAFFIAYMPPVGIHILLLLPLCFLLRANKFVAITCVWISNPLTFIPIYYPNYLLGRWVLAIFRSSSGMDRSQAEAMFKSFLSAGRVMQDFHKAKFWRELGDFFMQVGLEMTIGGIIIGGIVAGCSYWVTYRTIVWYRLRHPHRHLRKDS